MVVGLLVATSAWALTASAFDDRTAREGSSTTDTCFGQQPSIVGTRGKSGGHRWTGRRRHQRCPRGHDAGGRRPALRDRGDHQGGIRDAGCVMLDSGEGDDRVDATGGAIPCSLTIYPGPGGDEVLATRPATAGVGPFGVSVYAYERIDGSDEDGGDADVIRTGDGPDSVEAGVQDVVDLAGGDDVLSASTQGASSGGAWDGGAGLNKLTLTLWPPFWHPNRVHRWRVDNQAGQLLQDGETIAAMRGFTYFDRHVRGPFRFVGSDLSETVTLDSLGPELPLGSKLRLWRVVLEMGGGDDAVLYIQEGAAAGSTGVLAQTCSRSLRAWLRTTGRWSRSKGSSILRPATSLQPGSASRYPDECCRL